MRISDWSSDVCSSDLNPHDPAALDLRDLADERADGAGPGRHDDGLAFLRLADLEQAGICGKPGHAEDAEGGARRRDALVELHEAGPLRARVRHPAEIGRAMVHHRKVRVARGDATGAPLALPHPAHPVLGPP